MKNKLLVLVVTLLLCVSSLCASLIGCDNKKTDEEILTGIITLDKEMITLEKRESYKLTATLEDVEGDLVWTSSDETVVSVDNGEIIALKAGQAEIKASIKKVQASCFVTVEDNNQNLLVSTNLDDELGMIVCDEKDVSVEVFYNNKVINEVELSYQVLGEDGVVSFENSKLTAIKSGTAQLVITASWKDLEYSKVITVNVVPNLTAKISELNSVSLKTIGEENETSFEFNVVVYENNRKLNDGEFSIEFADVDEKIISIENNKVFAVGKGSETISAVITSLLTSDSITVELPVSVILVNQDKTSTIQLDKIAWDDESSPLALTDVFSDVDEQILSNCTIISIVDITGVECEIPYVNGEVDVEFLQNSSILGDRVWRVECEKFSYDVRVYIEKINTDALVASMAGTYKPVAYGNYSYASWETIVIGATGTIKGYGNAAHTLKVEPIDSNYGTFKDASRSEIVNGYYMKDGENFNLFVYSTDNSYRHTVQFVKQGVTAIDENAIYAKLAGTYSDGQKTTINLTNNNVSVSEKSSQAGNAKTCSGQVGGYKISGVAYDVIPMSATTGIITFISANGGFKENYSAIYTIDGDTVKLVVKYGDGIEMTKS